MDYYCTWINEGEDGCEGPWFDGVNAPTLSHNGDNKHITLGHMNQDNIGFADPVEGLVDGGNYVISVTDNPKGDWVSYPNESRYDLTFRPMTAEEAKTFNASLTLPF